MSVDLINRDPNELNSHVKGEFDDVFGEPDGLHSIGCVWKLSHTCFKLWRDICYKLYTLLFGLCIAASFGCEFAFVGISHVWYITPCMKLTEINCHPIRKLYTVIIDCAIGPCCEACGLCLSRISITKG